MSRAARAQAVWTERPVVPHWCGHRAYAPTLREDRARREQVLAGQGSEALRLYSFDPVLTLGRRPVPDLPPEPFWRGRGFDVVRTERGGLATLHLPGQIVGTLILDLPRRGLGVQRAVRAIESGIVHWLSTRGIQAHRRAGAPGVWIGNDKIASIGLHIRRGVSLHGFAVNVDPDLEPFGWFTPCGVSGAGATSVRKQADLSLGLRECALQLGDQVLWSLLESAVDSPGVNQ